MTRSEPTMTGMRSSVAPSSVANARPAVATKDSETMEATIVPAIDQAANVLSAPNRRNHRKPYTVETAPPPGREFISACEEMVVFKRVHLGAARPPLLKIACCIAAKQTNEPNSASRAGSTHHQSRVSNTCERPLSSSVCEESTHNEMAKSPSPNRYFKTGQDRRINSLDALNPCEAQLVAVTGGCSD